MCGWNHNEGDTMTKYQGTIFGFNYDIEFDTDEEFANWLFSKLKVHFPAVLWERIISKLLQQSDEYKLAKTKIQDHEERITALENP